MWPRIFTRRHQRNGSCERSSLSHYWAEPVLWFFSFQLMNHLCRCFMPIFICRIFLHENNASHQTWNITFKCIHLCKLKQTVCDGLITSYLHHAHILHSAVTCLINTLICFKIWHLEFPILHSYIGPIDCSKNNWTILLIERLLVVNYCLFNPLFTTSLFQVKYE